MVMAMRGARAGVRQATPLANDRADQRPNQEGLQAAQLSEPHLHIGRLQAGERVRVRVDEHPATLSEAS